MELEGITWLGHASFCIREGNRNVYIDLFKAAEYGKPADIVLVTHPHFDHYSIEDVKRIAGKDTEIFIPEGSVKDVPVGRAKGVEPGRSYESYGIRFRTVPAYNTERDRLQFHPKANGWVGYIVELNGIKIYHPGDTDGIDEMSGIDVDVALLPIGGTYTMDVDQAIAAAKRINAGIFVPMHYRAVLGKESAEKAEKKFLRSIENSRSLKEFGEPSYSF